MPAQHEGSSCSSLFPTEAERLSDGSFPVDDPYAAGMWTGTLVGEEATQDRQDVAVVLALQQLEADLRAANRIPENVGIVFCDNPASMGVSLDDLAAIEQAGYRNAGYAQRAEGEAFFMDPFRSCAKHGPLRFAIIVELAGQGDGSSLRPLSFFSYFRTGEHLKDEDKDYEYANAAHQWEDSNPGMSPEIHIVSKLVADPAIPRDAAALTGRALAATLRALASTNPAGGIYVEANAQPATQRFVAKRQRYYVPGMRVLLNQPLKGKGQGGAPAKMLLHVPPATAEAGANDGSGG